jgi:hypothetical protein
MIEPRPWHRLFGLSLVDFFRDTPVSVELEKDLSLKQQLLDVVLIHKQSGATIPRRLPDGFEELTVHNLVTFKSYQETLDGWALSELIGHYVNYRKQVSPSMQDLLPESDFRLFAVSVRFPQALARLVPVTRVRPGVYEVRHFTGLLRLIVVHELPKEEHNALLHLFSARGDLMQYGAEHYRLRSEETSSLLLQLFERYHLEATLMPDLLEQFAQETIDALLKKLPAERRLKGLSPDDLIAALQRLSPDDLAAALKRFSLDELLAVLSPEMRAALAQRLKESSPLPDSGALDADKR